MFLIPKQFLYSNSGTYNTCRLNVCGLVTMSINRIQGSFLLACGLINDPCLFFPMNMSIAQDINVLCDNMTSQAQERNKQMNNDNKKEINWNRFINVDFSMILGVCSLCIIFQIQSCFLVACQIQGEITLKNHSLCFPFK